MNDPGADLRLLHAAAPPPLEPWLVAFPAALLLGLALLLHLTQSNQALFLPLHGVGWIMPDVGLSRIMVGAHWPLDVVYGALGGWLTAAAGVYLARRWPWGLRVGPQRAFMLLLLLLAILLLTVYDTRYPDAWPLARGVALLAVICRIYDLFDPRRVYRAADGAVLVYAVRPAR